MARIDELPGGEGYVNDGERKVVEALAAGRPVIAAATGGLAELPAPVRLVPPADPPALGRAITEMLRTPISAESCRAASCSRDWRVVVARLHHHWLA